MVFETVSIFKLVLSCLKRYKSDTGTSVMEHEPESNLEPQMVQYLNIIRLTRQNVMSQISHT